MKLLLLLAFVATASSMPLAGEPEVPLSTPEVQQSPVLIKIEETLSSAPAELLPKPEVTVAQPEESAISASSSASSASAPAASASAASAPSAEAPKQEVITELLTATAQASAPQEDKQVEKREENEIAGKLENQTEIKEIKEAIEEVKPLLPEPVAETKSAVEPLAEKSIDVPSIAQEPAAVAEESSAPESIPSAASDQKVIPVPEKKIDLEPKQEKVNEPISSSASAEKLPTADIVPEKREVESKPIEEAKPEKIEAESVQEASSSSTGTQDAPAPVEHKKEEPKEDKPALNAEVKSAPAAVVVESVEDAARVVREEPQVPAKLDTSVSREDSDESKSAEVPKIEQDPKAPAPQASEDASASLESAEDNTKNKRDAVPSGAEAPKPHVEDPKSSESSEEASSAEAKSDESSETEKESDEQKS